MHDTNHDLTMLLADTYRAAVHKREPFSESTSIADENTSLGMVAVCSYTSLPVDIVM